MNGFLINGGNAISVINAQDLLLLRPQIQPQLLAGQGPVVQQQQQQSGNNNISGEGNNSSNSSNVNNEREVLPEEEKNRHQSEVKDLNIIKVGTLQEEVTRFSPLVHFSRTVSQSFLSLSHTIIHKLT